MKPGKIEMRHLVNREWQESFAETLSKMGFDSYGQIWEPCLAKFMVSIKKKYGGQKFENDVFILMPYYCGDDQKISDLPNFLFKSTGFEMSWYKYPLRSCYMNQEISHDEFVKMLEECVKSIKKSIQ